MKKMVYSLFMAAETAGSNTTAAGQKKLLVFYVLLAAGISLAVSLIFSHISLFRQIELSILDLRFKRRPTIYTSPRLGTIDIDSATIERAGGWPISRKVHADVIRLLHRYDASLVSLDVFFPDPSALIVSRDHLNRAVKMTGDAASLDPLKQLLERLATSPDNDFSAAIEEAQMIILAQTFMCEKPALFPDIEQIQKLTMAKLEHSSEELAEAMTMARNFSIPFNENQAPAIGLARAFSIEPPIPDLLRHAKGLGFAQIVQDIDGSTRKYPLFILYNGRLYPSLGLMGISILTKVPLSAIKITPGQNVVIPGARIQDRDGREITGDISIPVDRYLRMMVNWTGDYLDTFIHVPASALLRFRAVDLARERIHSYENRPADLVEKGFPQAIQEILDRRLLDETEAQLMVMNLMLAQIAESSQTGQSGTRDDFIRDYASGKDIETLSMIADIWDQVACNGKILALLKKNPELQYREIKKTLAIRDDQDTDQKNAVDSLKFIVKRGKDPEQWRPLYFFKPVEISYEGTDCRKPLSPVDLADKILYVGLTAAGTPDLRPMPFNAAYPMVGMHVNAVNTILTGQFLKVAPEWVIFLIALVYAISIAYLAFRLHPLIGAGFVVLLTSGYLWFAGTVFNRFGIWLPSMQLIMTVTGTYLATVIHNVLYERREKKKLRTAFSTYVPSTIVRRVIEDPAMLRLGGQRRNMTVFFSDVAHFTAIYGNKRTIHAGESRNNSKRVSRRDDRHNIQARGHPG